MKDLKFRTPVKCHNGHKSFYYWDLINIGVGNISAKVTKSPGIDICRCEGGLSVWRKDGDDQMFIGILSKSGAEIYHKDILKVRNRTDIAVDFYRGAFGYWVYQGEPYGAFISFNQVTCYTYDGDKCNHLEIIGSTHITPELLP